jgi:Protein of unknown function (DUF4058)
VPLDDWTRVNAGLFHHFHQGWCWEISTALNRGLLPDGYTALVGQRSGTKEADVLTIEERSSGNDLGSDGGAVAVREQPKAKYVKRVEKEYYADKASRVVIRHRLGRVVAFIEIVSPGNKHDDISLADFCEKIVEAIRARIHVMAVDLFPPTRRDPAGIHKVIWDHFDEDDAFDLIDPQNLCIASYEADGVNTAYIETLAVGEPLPTMPLFIAPGAHILVSLEDTYNQAWAGTPKAVRELVERGGS